MQAQNFHTPTYSETDVTGLGFGLTNNSHNATDTRSELGARYDKLVLLNYGTVLAWRAKVAWAHDWVTDPSVMPVFEALPGASFIVNGATPAKNSNFTISEAHLRGPSRIRSASCSVQSPTCIVGAQYVEAE